MIEDVKVFDESQKKEVYASIEEHLKYLPERFHKEFVDELLCNSGEQTPKSVRKNWEMYWEEISDEFTEEEKSFMGDNMCKCKDCEMLNEEIIKIIDDVECQNPFMIEKFHFKDGYKCLWNGTSSLKIEELENYGCRLNK